MVAHHIHDIIALNLVGSKGIVFLDWIKSVIVPHLRRLDGTKIIIGDNLSAHISFEAVQLCETNDIKFVFLPSNSTHMLQPLDVAVYAPLKSAWRDVLATWKKGDGATENSLPKDKFPRLLSNLMTVVTPNLEANVKAGFKKCGIYPLSLPEMLSRLPEKVMHNANPNDVERQLDSTFIQFLESIQPQQVQQPRKKRK